MWISQNPLTISSESGLFERREAYLMGYQKYKRNILVQIRHGDERIYTLLSWWEKRLYGMSHNVSFATLSKIQTEGSSDFDKFIK